MTHAYKYLIFPPEDRTGKAILVRPVGADTTAYLNDVVLPRLRHLPDDEYMNGPHAILVTAAHYSYVLQASGDVCWCVEWEPGLLVIRFSANGTLAWCALKSPNPEFGGRHATENEIAAFDEDAPNPQYDLVFEAWDRQLEPTQRKGWVRATRDEFRAWEEAMAHSNILGEEVESLRPEEREHWFQRCKQSPIWKGDVAHG